MSEDTTEGENDALTFAEMMETAEEQIQDEVDNFDGDEIPNHAGRLIVQCAADLNSTLIDIEVAQAAGDDIPEDEASEALAEDAVEIVLALGALRYEHDLDIEGAFRERMEVMEAMQEAESMEDLMRAMMDEEEFEEMMEEGPEPGDNVDREDYEAEGVERSFA